MKSVAKLSFAILSLVAIPISGHTATTAPSAAPQHLKVLTSKKVSPKTIRENTPTPGSEIVQDARGEAEDPRSEMAFGLGISTLPLTGNPSLSLLANLGGQNQAQFDLALASTSSFSLDVDFGYRYHISAMGETGLHVGFLARLSAAGANATNLSLGFAPIAGLHVSVTPDNKTQLSFDGGPELAIVAGNADFRLRAFSPMLGLSIHRLF